MTPEHLHLVTNHIPVIGAGLALAALIVTLVIRSSAGIRTSLAIAAAATATTPLVSWSGEEAEERMEDSRMLDAAGRKWMDMHEDRAEVAVGVLIGACVLCLAALAVGAWKPEWLVVASLLAGIGLAVALGFGAWAGSAGGQIRHPEIRAGR